MIEAGAEHFNCDRCTVQGDHAKRGCTGNGARWGVDWEGLPRIDTSARVAPRDDGTGAGRIAGGWSHASFAFSFTGLAGRKDLPTADFAHCPVLDVSRDALEWVGLYGDAKVYGAGGTLPRADWHPFYRDVLRGLQCEANAMAAAIERATVPEVDAGGFA